MDLIHTTINFLGYVYNWFFANVLPGILIFVKAFLNLVIAIFGFIIDILQWLAARV